MITKQLSLEEKLVNTIKGRIIELRTALKNTNLAKERASLRTAIANNCAWLLELGHSLNIPELEEV